MFGVFLLVSALQGPWSASAPRPSRAPALPARTTVHSRLDIDLSGLSDDDAVAAPGFSSAPAHTPARNAGSRTLVWSPRLGSIAAQGSTPAPRAQAIARQVSTLALATDLHDEAPSGRIDPAIGDLIGSVPLPMIGNPHAQQPRSAAPVTARTFARAPAPRRYEPGRW